MIRYLKLLFCKRCEILYIWKAKLFNLFFDHTFHTHMSTYFQKLGVPTFKKKSSDSAGWYIFWTGFCKDFRILTFLRIGPCWHMPLNAQTLPGLPAEQACWAELMSRGGLFDRKVKKGGKTNLLRITRQNPRHSGHPYSNTRFLPKYLL